MLKNTSKKASNDFPIIEGYDVTDVIGTGGMGIVYGATHLRSQKRVAVKFIHKHLCDSTHQKRFIREIELMRKLQHPNIVKIYTYGKSENGAFYIVMQYIEGTGINKLAHKSKPISPLLALTIILQVVKGLTEAHKLGIIHRDIKPHNIMYDKKHKRFLLIDFGVAKSFESEDITQSGKVLGSPYFLSPEQIRGQQLNEKTDIYALGSLFYKLVTGHYMYTAESAIEILTQHIKSEIPRLPESHTILQQLLDKMCAKVPEDRPSAEKTIKIILALFTIDHVKALPILNEEEEPESE